MRNSKTIENYKKAFDIISEYRESPSTFDTLGLLLKLAKEYPGELVSAFYTSSTSLRSRVITLLRADGKIQAIKIFRDEMKVGLKEAKDAVEKIAEEEGIPQFIPRIYD